MKNTTDNLKESWSKVPQIARLLIYAVVLAGIIFLLVSWFAPDRYQTLYTGLEVQDSLDIQQQLSTKGVDYKLNEDGSSILVDGDVIMLKRDLALQNLPQGDTAGGLAKFDDLSIGSTKFDKEVQYQNRLQEELQSSIIKAFEGVSSANVKLPRIEEQSIFEEEKDALRISVAIKTKNNIEMTPENVRAIQVFVAASIQEVKPEDVEVVDSKMNVLSGQDEDNSFGTGSNKQSQIIKETEDQIEKELSATLGEVYGTVKVIAKADINFDEIVQNIEKYDPEGTILSRETATDRTREITGGTAGTVGTDQNGEVPRYEIEDLNEEDLLYVQDKENLIENFAVGKTVEKIIKYPELRNINVAVWVDSNLSQLEIEELEEMISLSSGLTGQATRDENQKAVYQNGSVKVTQREFAVTEAEEEPIVEEPAFEMKWWYWAIAGGVLLLIIVIVAVMAMRASKRRRELEQAMLEQAERDRKNSASRKQENEDGSLNMDIDEEYDLVDKNKEKFKFEWTNKQAGLREATNDVSSKFPKETADVIKKFLRESDE